MDRRLWGFTIVLMLSGCAHGPQAASRLASASSASLCKHCNCFMPAGGDDQKTCPVCKCGYPAHACRRGVW